MLFHSVDGVEDISCGLGICSSVTSKYDFARRGGCWLAALKLTIYDITKQIYDVVRARAKIATSPSRESDGSAHLSQIETEKLLQSQLRLKSTNV